MNPTYLRLISFFATLLAITLFGVALAQEVVLFDPETWFVTQEAIFIAAALITPWITKVFTALGKDWFSTEGKYTQWLSLAVALVIAGVGGYLSLGYFANVSGLQGAIQAAFLTLIAFLGSNGMAKSERQVAVSAARKIGNEMETHMASAMRTVGAENVALANTADKAQANLVRTVDEQIAAADKK